MLSLPVPAFVALVLGYLALRALLARDRPALALFLAACAAQSLMVALVGGYGFGGFRPILPVGAAAIPPLAWIAFRTALFRPPSWREDWRHLAAPLLTALCGLLAPEALDALVSAIFIGYGAAILLALRRTPDPPLARLGAGDLPRIIWSALGWALIASAVSDLLIALAHASGRAHWAGLVISLFSSSLLLLLGLLSVSPSAAGEAEPPAEAPSAPEASLQEPDAETLAADVEILARLDAHMAQEKPHLDPELTLTRLARRLRLPEKRLSAAINRATGENVSRQINGWRVRHACGLLAQGEGVTEAMLASGFNTKSNFNREFLRVTGETPSAWKASRQARGA